MANIKKIMDGLDFDTYFCNVNLEDFDDILMFTLVHFGEILDSCQTERVTQKGALKHHLFSDPM